MGILKEILPTGDDPAGSGSEKYTYDAMGNILTAENGSAKLQYAYDPLGRLIQSTDHFKDQIITYEYDPNGNRISLTWADDNRTTFWEYDAYNRPETMIDPDGEISETDTLSATIANLEADNPILGEMGFTEDNYLTQIEEAYGELSEVFPNLKNFNSKAAGKPKNNFTFKTNWGHLKKLLPEELKDWFTPGHISDLLLQPQWTESFSYDARGNMDGKSNGWGDIVYEYNAENQMIQAGEREYSYDKNGNMESEWIDDLAASYAYDGENRLIEITTNHQGFVGSPGSLMEMGILYSYDPLGRRVSREEIADMQDGQYRDRFDSTGERMSYLYDMNLHIRR